MLNFLLHFLYHSFFWSLLVAGLWRKIVQQKKQLFLSQDLGSYIESFWNGDRPVLLLLGEGKGTKIELDSDLDFKFAQEWILNTRYIRYGTSLQSPKEYAETELKKRKQVLESKKEELKKLEQYIEKEEQEIIETEVEKELA